MLNFMDQIIDKVIASDTMQHHYDKQFQRALKMTGVHEARLAPILKDDPNKYREELKKVNKVSKDMLSDKKEEHKEKMKAQAEKAKAEKAKKEKDKADDVLAESESPEDDEEIIEVADKTTEAACEVKNTSDDSEVDYSKMFLKLVASYKKHEKEFKEIDENDMTAVKKAIKIILDDAHVELNLNSIFGLFGLAKKISESDEDSELKTFINSFMIAA